MKKTALLGSIFALMFLVACGTTQPSVGNDAVVSGLNKQLAKASVGGFDYKSTTIPSWKYDAWAKVSAPVIQNVLTQVPDGYVLQVTGHTDSTGPETAVGDKPGNIKISTDRAFAVHSSLKKNGITSSKLTYKGVGSSQPLPGVATDDASQRRVSFVVVPGK